MYLNKGQLFPRFKNKCNRIPNDLINRSIESVLSIHEICYSYHEKETYEKFILTIRNSIGFL